MAVQQKISFFVVLLENTEVLIPRSTDTLFLRERSAFLQMAHQQTLGKLSLEKKTEFILFL